MLDPIIRFSLKHKIIVLLFAVGLVAFGLFSLTRISIGAVPDVTNNQVQVITTSRSLSTQDIERFITYPVELQMANLPGVLEIRSISKFGLSVVTIVFEDDMGTYLPRQLIAEKIQGIAEHIPEGFGTPQMGPISTGLGEIYQYVLEVDPAYKDQYSISELRSIQDWIVKRQLAGVPGVVEINTWGGHLKQYEIAIASDRLLAMDVSIGDLMEAVARNNGVSGGGYIEKIDQAYFIRGEGLMKNLQDIENTVVTSRGGLPIFVRDVASVRLGSATRFGAITGNGEGEKVLGQVMMLKGANSKKVIEAVKARVASISETLPEGIKINAFLDRSELIERTTGTVRENLLLGCLIVIFVVVLLLGNWRSGLVVASVIPLSLLFAISAMQIFGVDANLMSLGAIDFGIIIDGAVIIAEFIAFRFSRISNEVAAHTAASDSPDRIGGQWSNLKDKITFEATSEMMNSAIFGQLIILIVFIPILTLSGVEGKMFRPMAITFGFALIGAMILCFTYVPVVASLVLQKPTGSRNKLSILSGRLLEKCYRLYVPAISWALRNKKTVVLSALASLVLALILFLRMGAEFVPTLDEGDFVIQPVLKTGTSLGRTIEITTKIESILMDQFPEVDQVVTRIGAAEVPTDPMSMEESDVIIRLKPRNQWVSASSKDELANRFKEALGVIPGMEVEFTQPIEMRFNELITGVRADIAIKVFGEDLSVLARIADEIGVLAREVPGAADVSVEKIEGLPQLQVNYDRTRLARHGLRIADVNEMVALAYGGQKVGAIFEGERQFDLVLRLAPEQRSNPDLLGNLLLDTPNGSVVPLAEVAQISFEKGAAKIARDDTRRRTVVGINVRDRDLESVVKDLQQRIEGSVELPPGYTIGYGGQFENLQQARVRLSAAVPIALLLILLLLYFAFGSLKEALLIFTAIPFAAVGGVLLLWVRDMPFSISAGVGFIALFGIAVLNGIVLIEHFRSLKSQNFDNLNELVRQGARDRLRAVLLTASAAALGFLPMAISTNAGAEVQRPLATVVIGGLVSATLLTLIVLPVLYTWVEKIRFKGALRPGSRTIKIFWILLMAGGPAMAQQNTSEVDRLVSLGLENNAGLKATQMQGEAAEAAEGIALDLGRTEFFYGYDRNNLANDLPLAVLGVRQEFAFPTVYSRRLKSSKSASGVWRAQYQIEKNNLERELRSTYSDWIINRARIGILHKLDSLYKGFAHAAERRFELGETNYLEKATARARQQQIQLNYHKALAEDLAHIAALNALIQPKEELVLEGDAPRRLLTKLPNIAELPQIQMLQYQSQSLKYARQAEQHRWLPDLSVEYFRGNNGAVPEAIDGYSLGVSLPLLFNGQAARVRQSRLEESSSLSDLEDLETKLEQKREALLSELQQQEEALSYYEIEGIALSQEILKVAERSFKQGEIDFFQYIQSLENGAEIQLAYMDQLQAYNRVVLQINFLTY